MGKRAKREERSAFLAKLAAQRCPSCGAVEVAAILYGLPRFDDELRADLDAGRVVLGGCCIGGDDPVWVCRGCHHHWGKLFPAPAQAEEPGGAPEGGV